MPSQPPLQELHATNPCAGKKDGTILPSAGCSPTYYQCWRGKPVSPNPKCAAPLVFNPKAVPAGCSYVGAVGTTGCNCAAAYKGERATACTICQVRPALGAGSAQAVCSAAQYYYHSRVLATMHFIQRCRSHARPQAHHLHRRLLLVLARPRCALHRTHALARLCCALDCTRALAGCAAPCAEHVARLHKRSLRSALLPGTPSSSSFYPSFHLLYIPASICLQKNQKAGVYPLYNKPWPRYVECSTQGPFVMPCNTGAPAAGRPPPRAPPLRMLGMQAWALSTCAWSTLPVGCVSPGWPPTAVWVGQAAAWLAPGQAAASCRPRGWRS